MIPGSRISGFGHCHLYIYLTRGIHGNLQTPRAFSFSFILSSLESPKMWPLLSRCSIPRIVPVLHSPHCPQHLPQNLSQHRCASLRVLRPDCTESSGHGCTKVFYGILISSACLTMLPVSVAFWALLPMRLPERSGHRLRHLCIAKALKRVSCKLVTNALSILYQPLLEFSCLHFLFTFLVLRSPGLPHVPCNRLLKVLIESYKVGWRFMPCFSIYVRHFTLASRTVFLSLMDVCRLLGLELLI